MTVTDIEFSIYALSVIGDHHGVTINKYIVLNFYAI